MKPELADAIQPLHQACGKDITAFSETFIERSMEKRMTALGIPSLDAYIEFWGNNNEEKTIFHRSLNIHYSKFFRSPLTYAVLEQPILPRLIKEKEESGQKEIRIWSAGCAAGEEAYSIAMILDTLTAQMGSRISFRIFATDISAEILEDARAGVYLPSSLENVSLKYLNPCFTRQGEHYIINGKFKRFVDFSIHDLLDPNSISPAASIYGDFDLILCCNVLFYYQTAVQQAILDRLSRSLSQRGYLVSGEAEMENVENQDDFQKLAVSPAIFQKRCRDKAGVL